MIERNLRLERSKLDYELKRNGQLVNIYRLPRNEYDEPIGEYGVLGTWDNISKYTWDYMSRFTWDGILHTMQLIGSLCCIYHETNSFLSKQPQNISTTRTPLKSPMLLCRYDDVKELGVQAGDLIGQFGLTGYTWDDAERFMWNYFNKFSWNDLLPNDALISNRRLTDGKFTVAGLIDIQEWGIYADISLERLDYGGGEI